MHSPLHIIAKACVKCPGIRTTRSMGSSFARRFMSSIVKDACLRTLSTDPSDQTSSTTNKVSSWSVCRPPDKLLGTIIFWAKAISPMATSSGIKLELRAHMPRLCRMERGSAQIDLRISWRENSDRRCTSIIMSLINQMSMCKEWLTVCRKGGFALA